MKVAFTKVIGLAALGALMGVYQLAASLPAYAGGGNSRPVVSNYYVAGSTAVAGWEQGLVAREPNLAKWHWSSISSSIHARNVNGGAVSVRSNPYHYSKPKVLALPVNSSIRSENQRLDGRLRQRDNGLLADARPVRSMQPVSSYGDVNGRLRNSQSNFETGVNGSMVDKQLTGRVLSY
ncbi:MAG TPA: hypothetical protein PKN86_00575 [Candidatus Obscuribacter sp.]|nr:hypothetical protein [Candidatus Obscuribacter sp.]MBK9280519.1 hypothetical protein [Candidatus Obscuribacter sp.]HMW89011.1 hypothetical protein [Candidatus Obscuribacter sp.]HMX47361.1 hypothetical protein [Candidatus Obscuribacter sp.]HMY02519.1 hypothetical protein [Candidatus Obscuribacter sp.]